MPKRVEVDAGTSVVWDNRDTAPHTATAAGMFDTKVIDEGRKSKPIKFDKPGEYPYICDLHPFMKATLVVK